MTENTLFERKQKVLLQLPAGLGPDNQPVLEQLEVWTLGREHTFELVHSPLFVRNLAAGDVFYVHPDKPADIRVLRRSGKLAIRVMRKDGVQELEQRLTPDVEKLDGTLDLQTERALVYSLHVNIGFAAVESLFDGIMAEFTDSVWYYGNIYDPVDGITPLNWWDEFINTV